MSIRCVANRKPGRPTLRAATASRIRCLLLIALAVPLTATAQGNDDLWEVTTKMEIPGMPMAMPAQTNRVCVAKNPRDEDYIPKRENCRVLESKRTGNTLTYKMACTGKDAMNVAGEMTYGTNSYEGRMQMSGKMEGQAMQMTQSYAGKRVGDCTATK
jgi:hypothetical protein